MVPLPMQRAGLTLCIRRVCGVLLTASLLQAASAADRGSIQSLIEQAAISGRIDPELGRRQAESALEQLRREPNPDLEIRAHLLLCDYYSERDQGQARAQIDAANALMPQATRPGLRAGVLNCQGETLQTAGQNEQAAEAYEQAVRIATDAQDDQILAEVLFSSGYLRGLRGE